MNTNKCETEYNAGVIKTKSQLMDCKYLVPLDELKKTNHPDRDLLIENYSQQKQVSMRFDKKEISELEYEKLSLQIDHNTESRLIERNRRRGLGVEPYGLSIGGGGGNDLDVFFLN